MSWNPNAFASIVQARPLPIFGRPVHHWDSSLRLQPGGSPQALQTLPHGRRPALRNASAREELPPRLDINPGPRVEWDFNPPETCAARHTVRAVKTEELKQKGSKVPISSFRNGVVHKFLIY